MGTLFEQPVRNWLTYNSTDIINFAEEIKKISKQTKLSFDQILKIYEIKEMQRKNDLLVIDGDIKDEQLSGFGQLLKKFNSSIEQLANQNNL